MKLARANEMQQLDQTAINQYGIPGIDLMENAGHGTVDYMLSEFGPVADNNVIIFIGPGNNGGDGLVIARKLHQLRGLPFIVYLVDPQKFTGDAATNFHSADKLNIPCKVMLDTDELVNFLHEYNKRTDDRKPWAIIDAIFGTGLQRNLAGHFLAAANCINHIRQSTHSPVIAVDIPSGLNADTGEILGACVQADHTVTYGLAKPAHFIHGGGFSGKLHIVDIGIPSEAINDAGLKGEALDKTILNVFNDRSPSSHKGNYGHILILAGSAGKSGAAFLSGMGALRIGTGLVTMTVPADLRTVFESNLFEAMTLLLPESRRYPSIKDYSVIEENLDGKTAMVIGPGIGNSSRSRELIYKLYTEAELPMVIDADGLNILAMNPDKIVDPPAARLLTPHPGEMARLTGQTTKEIQRDRLKATLDFTSAVNKNFQNVTTVLKGAGTVVCDPGGTWAINSTGNPGMAAGGMGDVLSGIIGGLLAQGMETRYAVRAAVFVHGLAADRLADEKKFGYLASEVAEMVPSVITDYLQENSY